MLSALFSSIPLFSLVSFFLFPLSLSLAIFGSSVFLATDRRRRASTESIMAARTFVAYVTMLAERRGGYNKFGAPVGRRYLFSFPVPATCKTLCID